MSATLLSEIIYIFGVKNYVMILIKYGVLIWLEQNNTDNDNKTNKSRFILDLRFFVFHVSQ